MIQTRRLESGITITLIHQPQATQAAALWRVNAGSLHEPDDWPGLAHLLEHMLFRESEDYRDDERLMRW
ncbi:insulinase family protein, partial [Cronobacter malonaticus]